MQTIGLLGGMSWKSSIEYYRIINEEIGVRLGAPHSARCIMYSVDFGEIERLQHQSRWDELAQILIAAATCLEKGGADFMVICTNTMHKLADQVQAQLSIPVLHIADATAGEIKARQIKKVGLLGTKFTMEEDFYKGRLSEKHGFEVLIPDQPARDVIHKVIYQELVVGKVLPASKQQYLQIINQLVSQGAQGIILGCTEIGLLISPKDLEVPVFDTTEIHAQAAVKYAIDGGANYESIN